MMGRVIVGLIVAFWLATMATLVRVEYFPAPSALETVPTEQVLRRLLSNAEPANLAIYSQGTEIGDCSVTVRPNPAGTTGVPAPRGYQVHTDLRLRTRVLGTPTRVRLEGVSLFDERYEMTEFRLNARVGDGEVRLAGDRASNKVKVVMNLGEVAETREFTFAQLGSGGLAGMFGLPQWASVGMPVGTAATNRGVTPRTRYDLLPVAGGTLRTYLVEYKLDERMWAKIWVSSSGEVLQVDTSMGLKMMDRKLAATTGGNETEPH